MALLGLVKSTSIETEPLWRGEKQNERNGTLTQQYNREVDKWRAIMEAKGVADRHSKESELGFFLQRIYRLLFCRNVLDYIFALSSVYICMDFDQRGNDDSNLDD